MNDTKESLILKRLYLALAELLTEHHEFLSVETNQQQDFISLSPRAHKDDAAKLVGQGGETFHAMRIICSVAAARLGVRFHLARIKDDNRTSKTDDLTPPILRRDWPQDEIFIAAQLVAAAMFGPEAQIEWNHQGREKS
ncbi:MAG: KH domain-containing protein, partial [Patescibacteria group bacterium]|nr:KH domain-containing protein [Patescibacteria group bacterium]